MWKQGLIMGLAIAGGLLITTQPVHAATTTTTSTISFTTGGELTLDAAPDFAFGKNILAAEGATIEANGSVPVQVSNPGFAENWQVAMKLSNFSNGQQKLKGTTLTLSQGDITSWRGNTSMAPTGVTGEKFVPGGAAQTVLNADWSKLSTDANRYDNQWIHNTIGVGWWNSNLQAVLDVPGGNAPGVYSATMTWSLVASAQ
ncbi:WxL domain-containing protein [Lacticaseibacillus porcinae]|uniref:WxL domain-containing protein n=1 Tax=Lacticaseibacillus porcinae TaxID=1123687 RepID=UPI000F7A67AC|nr:WxL domain-containing protein [Lacticaseibacillus porcinae]